jgi:hypothetical protein
MRDIEMSSEFFPGTAHILFVNFHLIFSTVDSEKAPCLTPVQLPCWSTCFDRLLLFQPLALGVLPVNYNFIVLGADSYCVNIDPDGVVPSKISNP